MRIELLVDSSEFWERARADLSGAQRSAYLQTFSFEGDDVGSEVAAALATSGARDRRLLVDGYSLLYHSDRLIPGPAWLRSDLRREVRSTHRWVRYLRRSGALVRFGNPPWPSPVSLIRRNHKKLAVFDGRVSYLGGINFCDHNFAWHDMMLRVEDASLARHLEEDFLRSWSSRPISSDRTFGSLRVLSLDGRDNRARFVPVLEAISEARHRIDVVSAYLSPPFSRHLAAARRRGVAVRVLTPERNNKPNLARFAREAAFRHDFELILFPGRMNHMKAMVIDDDLLIVGSSNFDAMSYHLLEELFVMTRDRALLDSFRQRVWNPDTSSGARRAWPSPGTRWGHRAVRAGSTLAAAFAAL